jgi:UDP-GlcNAc:undecaprenyl-phosphate GlcNAc-1-phosphate transferase
LDPTVQNVVLLAVTAFGAALALAPLAARTALARAWLPPEDGARLGRMAVVPRVGGLVVIAAFAIALLVLPPIDSWLDGTPAPRVVPLVFAAAFLAAAGLVEDVRGLPRQAIFGAQLAAALFLFWLGYRVEDLAIPFWRDVRLADLALPLTVAWLVATANVFDVVQGLDGLAGGLALATTLALLAAATTGGHWGEVAVLVALAGALAGFARFNFRPARIFLGRCGTRPIGLVLGALAVSGRLKSPAVLAVVVPLLALVVPLLDVALPSGDRPRLPHRIVMAFYGLAIAVATVTLVLTEGPTLAFGAAVSVALLAFAVTARGLGYWQQSGTQRWVVARLAESLRPSGDSTMRALEEDLARIDDLDAAWPRLCEAAWALGLVELHMTPRPGWEKRLPEHHSFVPEPARLWPDAPAREATWSFELQAGDDVVADLVSRAPLAPTEFYPMRFVGLIERLAARQLAEGVPGVLPQPDSPSGSAR